MTESPMAVTGTVPGGGRERLGAGVGAGAGADCTRTGRMGAVTGSATGAGGAVVAVVVVSGTGVGGCWAAITFSPACSTSVRGLAVGIRARAMPRTAATTASRATRRTRPLARQGQAPACGPQERALDVAVRE